MEAKWIRRAGLGLIYAMGLLAGGCARAPVGPAIVDLRLAPNRNLNAPLAAIVSFSTVVPTRAAVTVSDGEHEWQVSSSAGTAAAHEIAVLGLRPGRRHVLTVAATAPATGATVYSERLEFTADPLPPDFPPIHLTAREPDLMEPGVTLFSAFRFVDGRSFDPGYGVLVIVDDWGEVLWYYRIDSSINDARRLANGNILMVTYDGQASEIDMLGNVVKRYSPTGLRDETIFGEIPIPVDQFHHELAEMGNGDLLGVSVEVRAFDDFPTTDTTRAGAATAPTAWARVAGDVVVQFKPDGTMVGEWKMLDILDPQRATSSSFSGFWDRIYAAAGELPTYDWAHVNGAIHDPSDDTIIISSLNQDAVIKFSRTTGEVVWILGNPAGWREPWRSRVLRPAGGEAYPYHPHAPMLTPHGTLILFDNGWTRPGAARPYSRAVEYRIDEAAGEFTEVWAYSGKDHDPFYSPILSDADYLPVTGNVLVTDGARFVKPEGGFGDPFQGRLQARIVEVTRTFPPLKVFELILEDRESENPVGWAVYRSERLSGLYPPDRAPR